MKKILFYIFFLTSFSVNAEIKQTIDSLKKEIERLEREEKYDLNLFEKYVALRNLIAESDPKTAIEIMRKALHIAEKLNNKVKMANAYGQLGEGYAELDYTYLALENFHKSYELFIEVGHEDSIGYLYISLGNIYFDFKMYDLAVIFYQKAEKTFKKTNDLHGIALTYNNYGLIKSRQKQFDSAVYYFREALPYRFKQKNNHLIAYSYNYIALGLVGAGKADEALENLALAEKYVYDEKSETRYNMLHAICYNYSEAYLMKKDFALAEKYIQRSVQIASDSVDSHYFHSYAYERAMGFYKKLEKYREAIDFANKTLAIADTLRYLSTSSSVTKEIADIYERLNQKDSTLKYLKLHEKYNESINMEGTALKLSEMRTLISVFEKDKQIQIQELKLDKEKSEKQSLLLVILLLAVVLAGVILFFIFLRIKKAEKLKMKKMEDDKKFAELEMKAFQAQMNPHFIFNCLTTIKYFISTQDKTSANKYLGMFSVLLRMFLQHSKSHFISLREEINLLKLYVELEQSRFENGFDFDLQIEDGIDAETIEIPAMLFQPHVENAINHGLKNLERKGKLIVKFKKTTEGIIGIVEDDGIGREQTEKINIERKKTHQSMGLQISKERINVLNFLEGLNIKVEIIDRKDENKKPIGTRVEITIPHKN